MLLPTVEFKRVLETTPALGEQTLLLDTQKLARWSKEQRHAYCCDVF